MGYDFQQVLCTHHHDNALKEALWANLHILYMQFLFFPFNKQKRKDQSGRRQISVPSFWMPSPLDFWAWPHVWPCSGPMTLAVCVNTVLQIPRKAGRCFFSPNIANCWLTQVCSNLIPWPVKNWTKESSWQRAMGPKWTGVQGFGVHRSTSSTS